MNYKQQIHFLNDVITWRAHVSALITMDIIKSPFLHQCRLHSNVYGFKIVQKSFIQSSSNLQEANHLGFSCQQSPPDLMKPTSIPSILFYLPLQNASSIFLETNWWSNALAWSLWTWNTFYNSNTHKLGSIQLWSCSPYQ